MKEYAAQKETISCLACKKEIKVRENFRGCKDCSEI